MSRKQYKKQAKWMDRLAEQCDRWARGMSGKKRKAFKQDAAKLRADANRKRNKRGRT